MYVDNPLVPGDISGIGTGRGIGKGRGIGTGRGSAGRGRVGKI